MPRTAHHAPAGMIFHVLNRALTKKDLEEVRTSVVRGRPFGSEAWQESTAKQLGLESTFRARGRPRKTEDDATQ